MRIKNLFTTLIQTVVNRARSVGRGPVPMPPPRQLALELDRVTDSGLPLRDALPVRSAEYWVQLGHPDLAQQELQTLSASALCHPWALRVRTVVFSALHS